MNSRGTRSAITLVDIRFKVISRYVGARATTYTVRWSVNGEPQQRTFSTKRLAEAFRSELQVAARAALPFSPETGMPVEEARPEMGITWTQLPASSSTTNGLGSRLAIARAWPRH